MSRIMWKNITPWLAEDIRKETELPELDVFRNEPFVGLHIRRGDKISEGEMEKIDAKVSAFTRVLLVYYDIGLLVSS